MASDHRVDAVPGPGELGNERQQHRALAGISRSRLLAVLRGADRPMDVRALAATVGLHPNTAREHLDQLVAAGLVTRGTAAPAGRGRPGLRYAAARSSTDGDPHAHRALASVLAAELAGRDDAVDAAIGAGERWGERVAGSLAPVRGTEEAMGRLVDLLDGLGFAPERAPRVEPPLALRRCPFGSLARDRGDVVCNVHLGLMRGALRGLGAPLDAVGLDPFVEPSLCLARFESRSMTAEPPTGAGTIHRGVST